MVCDNNITTPEELKKQVLILILLEYGLREEIEAEETNTINVLILILLEYGLRPKIANH